MEVGFCQDGEEKMGVPIRDGGFSLMARGSANGVVRRCGIVVVKEPADSLGNGRWVFCRMPWWFFWSPLRLDGFSPKKTVMAGEDVLWPDLRNGSGGRDGFATLGGRICRSRAASSLLV
ncbi:hypothetical protein ACLOJK_020890 [Asimina triloba]